MALSISPFAERSSITATGSLSPTSMSPSASPTACIQNKLVPTALPPREVKTRSPHGLRTTAPRLLGTQRAKSPQPGRGLLVNQKCCAASAGCAASCRCAPAFAWPAKSGHRVRKSCRLSRSARHLVVKSRSRPEGARCPSKAAHMQLGSPGAPAQPVLAIRWLTRSGRSVECLLGPFSSNSTCRARLNGTTMTRLFRELSARAKASAAAFGDMVVRR